MPNYKISHSVYVQHVLVGLQPASGLNEHVSEWMSVTHLSVNDSDGAGGSSLHL